MSLNGPSSLGLVKRPQSYQELDKRWKIGCETTIKAKSMKGFSTATPKLIENKFALGEPTKELLEDWDSRAVQSVLELHDVVGADKYCCEFLLNRKLFFKISKKGDAKETQLRFLGPGRVKLSVNVFCSCFVTHSFYDYSRYIN